MKHCRYLILLLLVVGCSRPLPPMADAEQARTALTQALDAWKQGQTIEELAARTPPLYFNDPKCTPETKLISYELAEGHTVHGQSVRLAAKLNLKLKDGSAREMKARYLVDTSPAIVIVPD